MFIKPFVVGLTLNGLYGIVIVYFRAIFLSEFRGVKIHEKFEIFYKINSDFDHTVFLFYQHQYV